MVMMVGLFSVKLLFGISINIIFGLGEVWAWERCVGDGEWLF
jgi:hypothetical protein